MNRALNVAAVIVSAFCWTSFVSPAHSRSLENDPSTSSILKQQKDWSKEWDSLIFTVQWPVTTCLEWKEKIPSNTCILPDDAHLWTIHGLWPTKLGTMGPAFCNDSWVFEISKVKNLMPEMIKLWPNIHGGDTVDSLWKHEWSKHGTCAALHPKFSTEALYFDYSLNLAEKYQVQKILNARNIVPSLSATYMAEDVWQAVKDGVGASPAISCDSDKKSGAYYFSEIKLCFDPDLQLIDCQGESVFLMDSKVKPIRKTKNAAALLLGNCPLKKPVYYPGAISFRSKSKKPKKLSSGN